MKSSFRWYGDSDPVTLDPRYILNRRKTNRMFKHKKKEE